MSTTGVVAGVVSTVLLLLLIAATCCLWKRRGSRERMEEDGGNGPGFDNIAFRDVRGCGVGTLCGPLLSSRAAFNWNQWLGGSFLLILQADPLPQGSLRGFSPVPRLPAKTSLSLPLASRTELSYPRWLLTQQHPRSAPASPIQPLFLWRGDRSNPFRLQ